MARLTRQNLTDRIAPLGGALAALGAAGTALLLPRDMLEDMVWQSGIAALVPVAQPPLGITARAVLALGGAAVAAAVAWSALFLLFGPGGLFAAASDAPPKVIKVRQPRPKQLKPARADAAPVVRRADAHPDAPPRRPLSVSDLGAPMPPVPAQPVLPDEPTGVPIVAPYIASIEQPLPADLDQPLAAFDPAAVPDVPRAPVRPVAPLALVPGERIASVELPMPRGDETPSIESLLRRLEQGARRPRQAAAG